MAEVPADTIELYYWPTPNGWKISIALEEMGLPYVIKPVNIGAGDQFKPEFLAFSPNNRMPAIIDPLGPGGEPVGIFESGAILQYLGRKTGQFYPSDERGRIRVEEWLMWQMGGLGPMSGQASHFRLYAPSLVEDQKLIEYGQTRYTNEVGRLYGVMERILSERPFLAGDYSVADMAAWPWIRGAKLFGQDLDAFPRLKAWFETIDDRPAVKRGVAAGAELRKPPTEQSEEERKAQARMLFGQTASTSKPAG
jgi:GSH-dependent disulfide-bond oxidoreductase